MHKQIVKGMNFVASFANNRSYLSAYSADLLFFFVHIANTSDDPSCRQMALSQGKQLAKKWRKIQCVPRKPTRLIHTLIAEQAAHDLGCQDIQFRTRLHKKLSLGLIIEQLGFNPTTQPPPDNLNDECESCGLQNVATRTFCKGCRKKLVKLSKYDVWLNAIVVTHHLNKHRLVGQHLLSETLKWLKHMRPYPKESVSLQKEAWEATYAITHVIYGLTDYSLRPLKLDGLETELKYLTSSCQQAKDCGDLDLLGECIDAIRSFEGTCEGELVNEATNFLLSNQNKDGSWGDINHPPHNRMHTTWTVLDAIRGYAWPGTLVAIDDILG